MESRTTAVAVLALFFALACGGSDPEAELAHAAQSLKEARSAHTQAQEEVKARELDVDEANQRLAEARAALRKSEALLRERQIAVSENATDDVLFRTVQTRLLEDDGLESVAIKAQVSEGVVTLSGRVANAKLRDRAIQVAKETPGVVRVESQVAVHVSAPPAAGKKPAAR